MALEHWYRRTVLYAAGRPSVTRWMQNHGMKLGAARFVAAETLDEAIPKVQELNRRGLLVTLDCLGESLTDRAQVIEASDAAVRVLEAIDRCGIQGNLSIKLTQLGLLLDPNIAHGEMDRIVGTAVSRGQFVRIDMEDSSVTSATIAMFKSLLARYGKEHIGLVLQSYLYRSEKDAAELAELGANLRIVKGAYREPPFVAYSRKQDVDAAYMRLVCGHLERGCYTAVATHDRRLIEEVIRWTEQHDIQRDLFEFQMLYGIASSLQEELVQRGYKVRVYTPFGDRWYSYFTRRIAERPANLWFVAKNLLRR